MPLRRVKGHTPERTRAPFFIRLCDVSTGCENVIVCTVLCDGPVFTLVGAL